MCVENGKSRFKVFDERIKKATAHAHQLRSEKAYYYLSILLTINTQKKCELEF